MFKPASTNREQNFLQEVTIFTIHEGFCMREHTQGMLLESLDIYVFGNHRIDQVKSNEVTFSFAQK